MEGFTMICNEALDAFSPTSLERAVYVQMCSEAAWADGWRKAQGVMVPVKKGQLVYGRRAWADKFGTTEGVMRGVLKRLETVQLVNQMMVGKNCVVTVTYLAGEPASNREIAGKTPAGDPITKTENSKQKKQTLVASELNDESGADKLKGKTDNVPHQAIIDLYAKHLSELPQPKVWTDKRKKALKARWHSGLTSKKFGPINGLDWWDGYFQFVKECPHLMGKNDRGWTADLEWLVNESNLLKVIEGKYSV